MRVVVRLNLRVTVKGLEIGFVRVRVVDFGLSLQVSEHVDSFKEIQGFGVLIKNVKQLVKVLIFEKAIKVVVGVTFYLDYVYTEV